MDGGLGSVCLFCGMVIRHKDHFLYCDGRQGRLEALEEVATAPVSPIVNVRTTDPDTSYRAAFANAGTRDSQRLACYRALRAAPPGYMDWQLAERVGIQLNSANKRRGELVAKGLVVDSGRRGITPTGSAAIIWCAVTV
jgi:hypothetical protein